MTCICENPAPMINRYKYGGYGVVCMHCLRAGYKAQSRKRAQWLWEMATEPEKLLNEKQPFPLPAGFSKRPFLYGNKEE